MPVSLTYRFAFVHIRKTAGTSVVRGLQGVDPNLSLNGRGLWEILLAHPRRKWLLKTLRDFYPVNSIVDFPQWHLPALAVRAIIGPQLWKEIFSFAFVRNPWALVVSAYYFDLDYYLGASGKYFPPPNEPDRVAILRRCRDFADFVRAYPMLEPADQTAMIADEGGVPIVKYVGKSERLTGDFREVCAEIGIPQISLPHENVGSHPPYRECYNAETRRLVARYFERDIELYQYRF